MVAQINIAGNKYRIVGWINYPYRVESADWIHLRAVAWAPSISTVYCYLACLARWRLRSRTPRPSPFSSMNLDRASSKIKNRIASNFKQAPCTDQY